MKKVLFITYYWPPSGKASLHWPLSMIKNLPALGWQPSVLTVDEDTFSEKENVLLNNIPKNLKVYKAKSYEPFNIYRKFTGRKKDERLTASETISKSNKSLAHKISIWFRLNLFIPDARIGWYFPAVKKGSEMMRSNKPDAIISIGPPHTTHLIGKKLSKKFNVKHVPVFIDPWVDIVYYKDFKRSRLTLCVDNYLEKSVLQNAAAVIFVTKTMKNDYIKKYSFLSNKSYVLYWGYSEDVFERVVVKNEVKDKRVIVHAGNMFAYQNPKNFWKQIKTEMDKGNKFNIKFIGSVDKEIKDEISAAGLAEATEYIGFLPYDEMIENIIKADILLVCATEPRHVPGKLFEYLRTGNPVIAFGENNEEVKEILTQSNAGMMFSYNETGEEFFKRYGMFECDIQYLQNFDRNVITTELGKILNGL